MKLLDETAALAEIRSLLKQSGNAKLAVAFWGSGAIERLGLDREGLSVEILCNLESGACNPKEIQRLYDLPGVTLKSDPALHAKVYWTGNGVILGSSNASANGLAVEGDAANSWNEANVLLVNSGIIGDTEKWFDPLFQAGIEVSPDDIAEAKELWKHRSKNAPAGKRKYKTLLTAFRAAPDHPAWSEVKVAFATTPLEEEPELWLAKEKELGQLRSNVSAYNASWREEIGDEQSIIHFYVQRSGARHGGIWKALPAAAYQTDFPVVYSSSTIDIPSFGRLRLPHAEQQTLSAIASEALDKHGDEDAENAIIDLRTAMSLALRKAAPSERDFDRAMEAIYTEARSLGYNPTAFRKMLAEHGGVNTARRLVRATNATSGFQTLWEIGRLDLSVEALILDPKWRALFTPDEHKMARRRLRAFRYEVADER